MWSNWNWTDNIKKRVCRYLLQRYLGQYLQEKLSLDQLSVDVYHGTGNVTDVTLDTTALNSLAEQQNLPIEFIDGQLGNISVSIPWSSIMQDSCEIEISGMHLTIQPKGRHETGSSMLDSMWTSMASSMQLAEECLKATDNEDAKDEISLDNNTTPLAGLEHCAQTIDAVLGRVRMCFNDVVVRIMLGGELQDLPLACEFHIKMCKYSGTGGEEDQNNFCDSPFSEKKVHMEGVTCYIDIGGVHGSSKDQDLESTPTLIQVGRFDGRQTLKIKIKKDTNIRGPQVSVDCSLGSFCGFISPFQIHVLVKMVDELLHPYYAESASSRKLSEKPMDTFDFKRVEDELQEQLKPSGIGLSGVQKQYGWSFPVQDEGDEQFLPFETSKTNFLSCDTSDVMVSSAISVTSSVDSAAESLFCSSTASVLVEPVCSGHVEKIKFTVTCISASLVILEKDVLKFHLNSSIVVDNSVERLRDLSCTFFAKLGLGVALADKRNIDGICKRLHSCCSLDHIVVIATPIRLEGSNSTEVTAKVTSGHASFGHFQVSEFLEGIGESGAEYIQLVRFPDLDKSVEAVRVDFTNKTASSQLFSKSNIKFRIQSCHLELDLSILDRIVDILLPPWHVLGANILDSEIYHHQPHKITGLLMKFPKIYVNIRFPVPDLTVANETPDDKYKRNVRPDSVMLIMKNILLSTLLDSRMKNIVVETKCKEAEVQYKETQSSEPISVAVAAAYDQQTETVSMRSQGYDWPRVLFSFFTEPREEVMQEKRYEAEDESLASFYSAPKEPSPFSRQHTVHEGQLEGQNKKGENTMPGDAAEINKFIESTCATAKYNIQVDLRCVNINLHSKDLFEQLYNRISMDLVLWEPTFLRLDRTLDVLKHDGFKSHLFRSCRTSNDFEGDDTESQPPSFFAPGNNKSLPWKTKKVEDQARYGLNQVCLNISITEGCCSIATDAERNDFTGNEQLTAVVRNATVFIVSGYKGSSESGYVCALVKSIELYHRGSSPGPNSMVEATMRRIIYPSDDTIQATFQNTGNSGEMLSLAIKIDRDISTNIKTFKVATAIKKGTLFHRVAQAGTSWLGQLIEFFDVVDVPIAGYTPASVIVEFHLHLLECAIDYKPVYLTLRSILTLERLTISSNITAQARQSVLQILTEDAALFLSNKPTSVNIMEDYICVMDLGTLEILLRMCQNSQAAAVDLTLSVNKVHIRTCSDTYKAVVELFSYFASDGDLRNLDKESLDGASTTISKRTSVTPDQEIVFNDKDSSTEQLVAEAMFEAETKINTENTAYKEYENDENDLLTASAIVEQKLEVYAPLPGDPIMDSCGPVDIHPSDEEDFCILENDPGVGIISKTGEPTARSLVNGPITLVENHFSLPSGRSDILRAPKHYPKPTLRYTIHDLTIIWDVYAGQDFSDTERKQNDELEDILDGDNSGACDIGTDALECAVLFAKPKAFESAWLAYQQPVKPKNTNNWRFQGGRGRKKDVCVEFLLSKVKFQYEVYPTTSEICSRQILVINTVEIKDKLSSSQFNKMLYLHTSSAKPKQSHANMVVIKLVQTRTNPQLNIDECSLKVSVLPIRLNLDQDALIFLHKFYCDPAVPNGALEGSHSLEQEQHSIGDFKAHGSDTISQSSADSDTDSRVYREGSIGDRDSDASHGSNGRSLYFRKVIVTQDIPIRLDYHGKRMDMTHGPLAGILMGLAQLNNSEIRLKRINYPHGILGVDRLLKFIITEWSQDITKNQLPSLLGGVGPMHSFVQLFQGVRDLIWMPIEQYQKDGRIAKGIQRGANSFSTSTAMAFLEITNRMVHLIQGAAEFTYDMVSPGPDLYRNSRQVKGRKKRHTQPGDIRQGMTNAFHVVKDGLGDTAKNIVHVASKEHEQKGVSGAVGGVLRQLPPTVVHPIILVAEATSNVLDGFRSHLEPEFKKQEEEKWKKENS